MNSLDLTNRVAIVTGASRGIGKKIRIVFEEHGAIVHDWSRTSKVDITYRHDIIKALKDIKTIDILVNNAGIFEMDDLGKSNLDYIETNVIGAINCTQCIVDKMINKNYGKIVNISSIDGIRGYAKHAVYASTKGAIISMTRALAKELARYDINVNCISPGFVRTGMTEKYHQNEKMHESMINASPFRRLTTTDDVANVALFLVSDYAKNITGQNIVVDAGVTC